MCRPCGLQLAGRLRGMYSLGRLGTNSEWNETTGDAGDDLFLWTKPSKTHGYNGDFPQLGQLNPSKTPWLKWVILSDFMVVFYGDLLGHTVQTTGPKVNVDSLRSGSHGPVEIVDVPIKHRDFSARYVNVYQAGYIRKSDHFNHESLSLATSKYSQL